MIVLVTTCERCPLVRYRETVDTRSRLIRELEQSK